MVRLRLSFFELLLLAALTVLCQAQWRGGPDRGNDRARHYCRLWRHASVVAGSKIYIDGGNALMPSERERDREGGSNSSTPSRWYRGTNNNLLVLDVGKNFSTEDPRLFKQIRKTDANVPRALNEHALWYSKTLNKIYQLGGWASSIGDRGRDPSNLPEVPSSGIWEFDIVSERWTKADDGFDKRNTGDKIERQGAASYCDAPSLGVSFLFEGYVQQRSDKDYANYAPSTDFKYISGMLALDTSEGLEKPRLTNISTPRSLDGDKTHFGPRMSGGMVHIPVGEKGILVQLGGHTTEDYPQYGNKVSGANTKNKNIDLSFVDIYDISSGFWFHQQTFGIPNIPSGRSDFCLVAVSAPDGSSHNIYMVSGMDNPEDRSTKSEIWVLTLPSFNWVLIDDKAQSIYGHTCHVVGDNLLVIGGMDSFRGGGGRGGELQVCDGSMMASVFSLRTNSYVDDYDVAGATRTPQVPIKVVEAVGGSATGGAHVRSPRIWSDTYLQYVFNPQLSRPEYKPGYKNADGSDPPGEKVGGAGPMEEQGKKRAIVGVVVGAVFGGMLLIAIVAGAFVFLRRRHKRKEQEKKDEDDSEGQKLDDLHHQQHTEAELPAYSSDKNRLVELAAPPPPSEVEGSPGHMLAGDMSRPTTARTGYGSVDSAFLSPQSLAVRHDGLSGTGGGDMVVSAMTSDNGSWRPVGGESPPPLPEKSLALQREISKPQSVASSMRSKKNAMQNHGFL
ncbi:hypothetical protein PspLS_11400 [Pyricularia sp. CBS 133598]|nr:hypothetical protein PspLS_11400 [Pyricularia sp. CBS 133598]